MAFIRKALNRITSRWVIFLIEHTLILISFGWAIFTFESQLGRSMDTADQWAFTLINFMLASGWMLYFRTHEGIIRFTEIRDVYTVIQFSLAFGLCWLVILVVGGPRYFSDRLPYTIAATHIMRSAFFIITLRVLVKEIYQRAVRSARSVRTFRNVLIYGAGDVGMATRQALELDKQTDVRAVGYIDDNVDKIGKNVNGLRVMGSHADELRTIIGQLQVKEIILATNKLSTEKKLSISELCTELRLKLKQIPELNSWIDGVFREHQLKQVEIEDLLQRPVIEVFNKQTARELHDAVVLVTGAAGSIGSEVCRQISRYNIKQIIALDQSETGLFELENEFKEEKTDTVFIPVLASVRDKSRMDALMAKYAPKIVFHAAAYKHVPMLENFPAEVVRTNVEGTKNVIDAAIQNGVSKFVLISSDKAVNPTNLMGASKRIGELYLQHASLHTSMKCITTRFGNVLGSNGSVVPTFRKQIEHGGPLTVTHPDITRYFMTIPEASSLVVEAATMGQSNEVFVFDMGEPIRIKDLALRMIRLAGLIPEQDIRIEYTGLRQGEKLYEELFTVKEMMAVTHHPKILKSRKDELDVKFIYRLEQLLKQTDELGKDDIIRIIQSLVPEMSPSAVSTMVV